jgi:transposase
VVRLDATTVSAYHQVEEGGLVQFGHSKDDPSRPQIKLMLASLDPMGMPLASHVVSGERADDGLYLPILKRLEQTLCQPGLLYVVSADFL